MTEWCWITSAAGSGLVPVDEATVSVFDHGLVVGDGAFETMKVVGGRPFALRRHLDRLAHSATALGLGSLDRVLVGEAVAATLAANPGHDRVRVTLTAGPGPLGSARGDGPLTLIVATSVSEPWPATTALAVVPWTRNESGALAGVKSTSYADNVVALAEAHRRGAGEALFTNTQGFVCEGTGTNVFAVLDGEIVTPPLSSGCLAGVTRALVCATSPVVERDLTVEELSSADEVFVTSSTRDVHAVDRVDDVVLDPAPGPVTTTAARRFADLVATDLDP